MLIFKKELKMVEAKPLYASTPCKHGKQTLKRVMMMIYPYVFETSINFYPVVV